MPLRYDLADSLKDYRAELNLVWPGRDKASDGWVGDTSHAARPSDHNPDNTHPVPLVRAFDADRDGPDGLAIGETIAEHLRASRDYRIKYVIWNGRMFSSYATTRRRAWEWGPYSGVNAHRAHVHLSVRGGLDGSRSGPWGLLDLAKDPTNPLRPPDPIPTPAPPAPPEDQMYRVNIDEPGHKRHGWTYLIGPGIARHLDGEGDTAWRHLQLVKRNARQADVMRSHALASPVAAALTELSEDADDVKAILDALPAETVAALRAALGD